MNWYKVSQRLQDNTQYNKELPLKGYKVVGWDGARAYSLQNLSLTYDITPGATHSNLFLGTNEQFVLDYYSGLTDDQDVLLEYEYYPNNIISGGDSVSGSEVYVGSATLKRARFL